jgi:hypothetical protein
MLVYRASTTGALMLATMAGGLVNRRDRHQLATEGAAAALPAGALVVKCDRHGAVRLVLDHHVIASKFEIAHDTHLSDFSGSMKFGRFNS